MDFENYINKLFISYIYEYVLNNNINEKLFEYNDIIVKDDNNYVSVGNKVKQELLTENDIAALKKYYQNNTLELNDEIKNIFDLYLNNMSTNIKDKYYFKINDGDVNPNNVVDYDTIVLIAKIKVDYNVDYNLFLKKYSMLRELCNTIEKNVKIDKKIKIKFLFDLLSNIVNNEKKNKEDELLKRQYLIEFEKKFDKSNIEISIKGILRLMKELIDRFQYKSDDRFYTFGRRNIVINEFNNNILENNLKDAYSNLQDIINCDDFITLNARDEIIASGLDYNKVQEDMNNYKNDGYICLQEKDIIIDMISKLKNIIDGDKEMDYKFYLINEKRLLCSNKSDTYELDDGKWIKANYSEIGDKLMGYDSSEKGSLYGIGNTDVLSEIKELTREQAIELVGEEAINSL